MITSSLVAAGFGLVVGVALGLTGGGGSIFAMPLLIYGLHLSPREAVPASLVAVGTTALVGGLQSIRARLVVWQPAIVFVIGGILGAPSGVYVAHLVPAEWIVTGFAVFAAVVGTMMWTRARTRPDEARVVRKQPERSGASPICVLTPDDQLRFSAPCALVLTVAGLGTGFLSGLFGIGGGFLIVPTLIFVTSIGVHSAIATSLLIIAAIGFSGALSALAAGAIVWPILVPFAIGGVLAMLAVRRFARRISGPQLQRVFSVLIVLVGVAMLVRSLVFS